MTRDKYGRVSFSANEIFDALYCGKLKSLNLVTFENEQEHSKFCSAVKTNYDGFPNPNVQVNLDIDISEFDSSLQKEWFMPDEYKNMDIEGLLTHLCPKQNYDRMHKEIVLFRQHNMIELLKYLKYLVDTMRKHNIVWGVGRGSSVSSYCLYLLGVHKIDSIKYDLDIKEFLR